MATLPTWWEWFYSKAEALSYNVTLEKHNATTLKSIGW